MINLNLKEEGIKEIKCTLDNGKIVTFSMRDSVLQDVDVVVPQDNTKRNEELMGKEFEKLFDDYIKWTDKYKKIPLSKQDFKILFLSKEGVWKGDTKFPIITINESKTPTSLSKNGDIRNTLEAARTGEWKENVKATGSFVPKPEPRDGKPINRTPTAASDEEINDFKESQKESDEYRWDKIKKSIEKEEDEKIKEATAIIEHRKYRKQD